jgi:hypothetical protein
VEDRDEKSERKKREASTGEGQKLTVQHFAR